MPSWAWNDIEFGAVPDVDCCHGVSGSQHPTAQSLCTIPLTKNKKDTRTSPLTWWLLSARCTCPRTGAASSLTVTAIAFRQQPAKFSRRWGAFSGLLSLRWWKSDIPCPAQCFEIYLDDVTSATIASLRSVTPDFLQPSLPELSAPTLTTENYGEPASTGCWLQSKNMSKICIQEAVETYCRKTLWSSVLWRHLAGRHISDGNAVCDVLLALCS